MSLRERQRATRRNTILTVAEELFRERGFDSVTTRAIAEAAEIGEATLFRYFGTKSEIFFAAIGARVIATIDGLLEQDAEYVAAHPDLTADDYVERALSTYRARARAFTEDPTNILTFALLGLDPDPALHTVPIGQGDRVVTLVRGLIENGQQRGKLNPDVSARDIAANLNGTYIHEMARGTSRNLPPAGFEERLVDRLRVQLAVLLYRSTPD
ncbi:helix-turn-helix domain-containing protein [Citricoccus sp. I39-566]|uniref:TetR/AcrR family transcriptional regulator n=1 Tax=Citricoccus sp. I39-566 TaxID=3073268 RepID=UPI00286CB49E|nr:helix-turn-helix domain-containing protein [Citricoccus sp. I39-566]WMY78553.1 helix-turn-helix domain-containing protein [Citricoccus sp. I39-566]